MIGKFDQLGLMLQNIFAWKKTKKESYSKYGQNPANLIALYSTSRKAHI